MFAASTSRFRESVRSAVLASQITALWLGAAPNAAQSGSGNTLESTKARAFASVRREAAASSGPRGPTTGASAYETSSLPNGLCPSPRKSPSAFPALGRSERLRRGISRGADFEENA